MQNGCPKVPSDNIDNCTKEAGWFINARDNANYILQLPYKKKNKGVDEEYWAEIDNHWVTNGINLYH